MYGRWDGSAPAVARRGFSHEACIRLHVVLHVDVADAHAALGLLGGLCLHGPAFAEDKAVGGELYVAEHAVDDGIVVRCLEFQCGVGGT